MLIYRNAEGYMARENLATPVLNLVPSPRGSLGWLSPPNKAPSPPKLKHETINQWKFLSNFSMSSHPAETQSPPVENFLATVLPKPRRQTINESACCFD